MEDYYNEKIKEKQKKRILKKILIKLIYILILPIIIWDLILIIKTIQNPNETPSVFGIKTFCIITGSMEPNIKINDIVIIKQVKQSEINTEDIISFNVNGEIITHRIINIEVDSDGELLYTTRGDSNNIEDRGKIKYEDIEGKYIGKIPKVGKIILALKNKTTLILILSTLIVVYIWEQSLNNRKIKRKNEREEYKEK